MKQVAILHLIFLITTAILNAENGYHPSRGEQLVNMTLEKTAQKIEKEYDLLACGTGAAMPGGPIRSLFLSFSTKKSYSKDELRVLLIKISELFLNQINSNEEMRKFLIHTPFTVEDIDLVIYNQDKSGRRVYDPLITVARLSDGILIFRTIDPSDEFKYKNTFKESYEEALKETKLPRT